MRRTSRTLAAMVAFVLAFGVSLAGAGADEVSGSGNLRSEGRPVGAFSGIAMEGVGNLVVAKATVPGIRLTMDDNLLAYYETRTEGGILHLGFRRGTSVRNPTKVLVEVALPSLGSLSLSGACEADLGTGFAGASLALAISGAGSLSGRIQYTRVRADLAGTARLVLAGTTDDLILSASGAGVVDTSGLAAARLRAELSGATRAALRATATLGLTTSGAVEVQYYGSPVVTQRNSGASRVVRAGP